jgi:hypothetical protein
MNRALLLLMLASRHYGWALAAPEQQARVWNILGAAVICAFILERIRRTTGVELFVLLWFLVEELMVIECSSLRMWLDWWTPPGQGMCSGLIRYDLGTIGLAIIGLLAALAVRTSRSSNGD